MLPFGPGCRVFIFSVDRRRRQRRETGRRREAPAIAAHRGLSPTSRWTGILCAGGDEAHRKPLPREFFRQALLIAARDQLGLSTRDAWLGDPMPTGGNNAPFDLRTKYEPSTPVEILRGYPPAPPLVKRYELKLNGDLPYLAAEAEKLSRTKFVEALKEAGFSGKANPWTPEAKMPDHIEPLLCEMTFTSQFQALRELHEAIHCGGESPALLGGLVRGYANLGVLTEYLWHPEHKAFKARAWLYAERMVARDEHSALALASRVRDGPDRHAQSRLGGLGRGGQGSEDRGRKARCRRRGRRCCGRIAIMTSTGWPPRDRRQPRASWPDCWPIARRDSPRTAG